MRIKNNISALNAQIALTINESKLTKDLEKLTSGYRINRSGDDAAGLAISEQMRSQIAGIAQAELNARDGIGLVRTGEGAMQEIHAMLTQMNELAIQSANGVYSDDAHRALIQEEADRICQEIDRIAGATRFNYVNLFQSSDPDTGGFTIDTISAISTTSVKTKASMPTKLPGMPDMAASANGAATTDTTVTDAAELPGMSAAKNDAQPDIIYTGKAAAVQQTGTIGYGNISGKTATPDITAVSQTPGVSRTSGNTGFSAKAVTGTGGQSAKEATDDIVFQVGPNAEQTLRIPRFYLCRDALKLDEFKVNTQEAAVESIDKVENMINYVSKIRGAYGALDNALEHTINSMNVYKENLTAAESRIRDTDMASQMTELTKNNIVMQASQAMLAQANALPETALSLLR